jgi:hypothetical protein
VEALPALVRDEHRVVEALEQGTETVVLCRHAPCLLAEKSEHVARQVWQCSAVRVRTSAIAGAGALLLFARAAHAAAPDASDKVLPCRPTIACTAVLVPPGAFELETGWLVRTLPDNASQTTVPFLAKLTLAEWVQVQAGSNGYTILRALRTTHFFDEATLGLKLHVLDQSGAAPSLSFSATGSFPISSDESAPQTYDAFFTAYATKDFGWLHIDLNSGANAWRLNGDPIAQGFYALALSGNLPPPFGVMLESYYFSDATPAAPKDGGVLFAITHSPKPWLLFDLGGDVGFFPSTRKYSVFVGMTIVPFVLWR